MNVSDFILQRLADWDISKIFGYPGDGINGLLGAMNRNQTIRFIQTRHEEMAAFMACGHAKFTGEVGVCMATSGPGAIHLLNGLYDAKLDHQPVVAIIGQQKGSSLGSSYQQEVDLASLYKDVAGSYVQMIADPIQVRQVIDRAFRIAKAERTVTAIIIPNDIQEENAIEQPPRMHGNVVTGAGHSRNHVTPSQAELLEAADILNAGKKVAILIGAGAFGAQEEIMELADLLGAGVAKALLGKAVLPDDLPYVTGSIGMLGSSASWELMDNCDTLLMIGSSFPYAEYLPEPGKARGVQIDLDGKMLSIRYPMDVNLLGDSKDTLKALIPLLKYKDDRSWRKRIEKHIENWWQTIEDRANLPADPINPQLVIQRLSPLLPDNCILTADSGTSAFWYARNIKIRKGMMASLSGNLATMCPSVPYAIAAKFAYPDRFPIAITGDGAMQMLGMNELITISKYWREWADPRLLIIVLNNQDLNMVTWEQRMLAGEPKFEASQDIPDIDYAAFAQLLGLKGVRIDRPEQIGSALEIVLNSDRPSLLDVVCDPNVPIMPPHVDMAMLSKFSKAMIKGDPASSNVIRQVIRQAMQGGSSF
jgi:pyruvate dehydrogenase (quinone)